jgi:cytoskeleton protein RodZ
VSAIEAEVETSPPSSPSSHDGPGARLKVAREAAGLSLEQVAQQLKLAPRQVRALEEEDFAQLPGRTFARGFVRNYARLLNLDGADLLSMLPDAEHAPALGSPALHSTGAMIAELPTAASPKPNFMRWLIPLVLVGCIVGAALYEWHRGGLMPGDASAPAAPQSAPAPPAAADAGKELPNPYAAETPASEATAREGAASEATTRDSAASEAAARDSAAEAPSAPVATVSPGAVAQDAAISPAPLQISYRGSSWTQIRDRRGHVLLSRVVAAGSEQAIRGEPPFDVVIGNPRAVVLVYKGKPVDLSRFTRQNVARLRLQ